MLHLRMVGSHCGVAKGKDKLTYFQTTHCGSLHNLRGFFMFKHHLTSTSALALLACAAAAPAVYAQETTSAIRGAVTDAAGAPVAGAAVVVTHVPSGTRAVATTNSDGSFATSGLRVGGPYQVVVTANGFEKQTVSEITLNVGEPFRFAVALTQESAAQEEIVVVASKLKTNQLATGAETTADRETIAGVASINRDIRDVLRRDPLVSFDPINRTISIAGANDRNNRLTVDGVPFGDSFGLNNARGGFPTVRGPISIDAACYISAKTAPVDIVEGNFQGGSVNIGLCSGGNEFKGIANFSYANDDLAGDTVTDPVTKLVRKVVFPFSSKQFSGFLSGPIFQDKLFFMIAYDQENRTEPNSFGVAGSGAGSEISVLSRATLDNIINISKTRYGFDPLDVPVNVKENDRKINAKIDWNISDDHRLAVTYIYNKGVTVAPQGNSAQQFNAAGAVTNSPTIGLQSNWYSLGEKFNAGTVQLNSNWSDIFSTEFRGTYRTTKRDQVPFAGRNFPNISVCAAPTGDTALTVCPNGSARVLLGPDVSRQVNEFDDKELNLQFTGTLKLSAHTVKLLFGRREQNVNNLFLQRAAGDYYFDSVAQFNAGTANQLRFQAAFDPANGQLNNELARAKWGITNWTIALQDTWEVTDTLTMLAGVRYDWYGAVRNITPNANFLGRTGFLNNETINGRDLIQPRFGIVWKAQDRLRISAGAGIYGGGDPLVFFSNPYSNDGVGQNEITIVRPSGIAPLTALQAAALNGVSGATIPALVQAAIPTVDSAFASVNSVDPNYKIASLWKTNLSVKYDADLGPLGDDWNFGGDFVYTRAINTNNFSDLRIRAVGAAPDGRVRYAPVATCFTTPTTLNTNCANNNDIMLTNGSYGSSRSLVFKFSKEWDLGLSLSMSYTNTKAFDQNNGQSAVAFSNYDNALFGADPNSAAQGRSQQEIRNQFKYGFGFKRNFFGDNETRIDFFGEIRSGRPYSITMLPRTALAAGVTARNDLFGGAQSGRYLLFVPDFGAQSTTNPLQYGNVLFADTATRDGLQAFVEQANLGQYKGQIINKNSQRNPTVYRLDMRLSQEIPAYIGKIKVAVDFENLLNLINSSWGQVREVSFPGQAAVVDASCSPTPANCSLIRYASFRNPNEQLRERQSLWGLRLSARLEF
jgi:Carboxypeptidase regulatory-like domain/TonB dependent receptor